MKEKQLLQSYPKPKYPRIVSKNLRTIEHRLIASERGQEFFDGDRNFGYGGFNYDGRWKSIAKEIIDNYGLTNGSKVLQVQCEKGFLLKDIKALNGKINVLGTETSGYALSHVTEGIKENVLLADVRNLPFENSLFDLVIALGVVYTFNLTDAIRALKEIQRVAKRKIFITLASYEDHNDYFLFKYWTLLGTMVLKKEEWIKVLRFCNYEGDYSFTNAESLELQQKGSF